MTSFGDFILLQDLKNGDFNNDTIVVCVCVCLLVDVCTSGYVYQCTRQCVYVSKCVFGRCAWFHFGGCVLCVGIVQCVCVCVICI